MVSPTLSQWLLQQLARTFYLIIILVATVLLEYILGKELSALQKTEHILLVS